MNRNLVLLGICLLAYRSLEGLWTEEKPRIGIAGIQIENSVFVPNRQPLVGHFQECRTISAQTPQWDEAGHLASQYWLWRWKRPCDKRIVRRICGKNIGDDQG